MNAATQNTWTSYRDGNRVMHYLRDSAGTYYVQKVQAGYNVSFLPYVGDGVSALLATMPTLAAGKKWVAEHLACPAVYGSVSVGAAVLSASAQQERPALGDDELYECEIPGTPGRVTLAQCKAAVHAPLEAMPHQREAMEAAKAEHDRGQSFLANSARQLGVNYFEGRDVEVTIESPSVKPGTYTGFLDSVTLVDGRIESKVTIIGVDHAASIGGDLSVGFSTRLFTIGKPTKAHRPNTYKPYALGIDTFKVLRTERVSSIDMAYGFDRQDERVCRIEQELVQYAGKRRTPHRDRKVAKLRKILRILKRGLYE